MVTALFKKLKVKCLMTRAINPLHENVLQAIGVDEIIHPEIESAERWAKKLCLTNVVDSFELNENYSIIEAKLPSNYEGKTIREVDFREQFQILVLTIIKKVEVKGILGKTKTEMQVQGIVSGSTRLEKDDILVLYGFKKHLREFLEKKEELS